MPTGTAFGATVTLLPSALTPAVALPTSVSSTDFAGLAGLAPCTTRQVTVLLSFDFALEAEAEADAEEEDEAEAGTAAPSARAPAAMASTTPRRLADVARGRK
ncbi:hypothetical protein SANTM175S_07114 [Streptomyces antimycoticus]